MQFRAIGSYCQIGCEWIYRFWVYREFLCVGCKTKKLCYRKNYLAVCLVYTTRKSHSNLERAASPPSRRQSHWFQWKVPNFPAPKTALPLRRLPPKFNTPIPGPNQPPFPTASGSTQPFCHNTTSTSTQPSIKLPIDNHATPQTHPQNCRFPFDDSLTTKI